MTVAELISRLRAMPQDLRVVVDGYESGYDDPIVKEAWAILNNGDRSRDYPLGLHDEVYAYLDVADKKRRGAELVIVIARNA